MRKAKIICAIISDDRMRVTVRLIEQGMNAARLNFSHGARVSRRAIKTIPTMGCGSTPGPCLHHPGPSRPRIRVWRFPRASGWKNDRRSTADHAGPIRRSARSSMLAASGMIELPVTYNIGAGVRPGSRILINAA